MNIELQLFDRNGERLYFGDIVKISNGKHFTFFSEVKYIESEQSISPFHTFSFHSVEKVDAVPDNAVKSNETRYNVWYITDEEAEQDSNSEDFNDYATSWRECEFQLEKRAFRISIQQP